MSDIINDESINTDTELNNLTGTVSDNLTNADSEAFGCTENAEAETVSSEVEAFQPETVNDDGEAVGKRKKKKEKKIKAKKDKKPFFPKVLVAAAVGLAFGIFAAGGFYGTSEFLLSKQTPETTTNTETVNVQEIQNSLDELQKVVNMNNRNEAVNNAIQSASSDVSAVVDKVMPSMVCITNIYEEVSYFFGRTYVEEREASGSGIIIGENDNEFLIATNYHVIENAKALSAKFIDDKEAAAYVKGYDSAMDIALIAVSKESIERDTKNAICVAELGDSDSLKMGEAAIAIGNALGYGQSVTTGVISALNREIDLEKSVNDLIQTSAAINPGNSGGALLNIKGQVIGINSSKIGASLVEGMGFAIPINEVKDILFEFSNRETTDKYSEETKGYLGIAGKGAAEVGLTSLGYPEGVYIAEVYEGSAAEKAGIFAGDIITKAGSQSISAIEELQELLGYYKVGDTISVTLVRRVNGSLEEIVLEVVLGSRDTIPE